MHQPCSSLSITALSPATQAAACSTDWKSVAQPLQSLLPSSSCFSQLAGIQNNSSLCPGPKWMKLCLWKLILLESACLGYSNPKHPLSSDGMRNCGLWYACYPWDLSRAWVPGLGIQLLHTFSSFNFGLLWYHYVLRHGKWIWYHPRIHPTAANSRWRDEQD